MNLITHLFFVERRAKEWRRFEARKAFKFQETPDGVLNIGKRLSSRLLHRLHQFL